MEVRRENKRLLASITNIIIGGRSEERLRVGRCFDSQGSVLSRASSRSGCPADAYNQRPLRSLNRNYQIEVQRKIEVENKVTFFRNGSILITSSLEDSPALG